MKTWLRRNVVALLMLPLLVLGLAIPDAQELYVVVWTRNPHVVTTGGKGEEVHLGPATIRLTALAPVSSLTTKYTDETIEPPPGYRFWQAELTFALAGKDDLSGCTITLEDALGRQFSDSPPQLTTTGLRSGDCAPRDDDPLTFDVVCYFLLPSATTPTAIRIVPSYNQLPHYVRLLA